MIKNMIIGKLLPIIIFIGAFFAVSCIGESYDVTGSDSQKETVKETVRETVQETESGSLSVEEDPGQGWKNSLINDTKALSSPGVSELIFRSEDNDWLMEDIVVHPDKSAMALDIYMPCRVDASKLVFYVKTFAGDIMGPYAADFTDEEVSDNERYFVSPYNKKIRVFQSGLPSMMIFTDDDHGSFDEVLNSKDHSVYAYGNMYLTVTDKDADEKGWMPLYFSKDEDHAFPGSVSIRGRGNATWDDFEKKPFRIKTENKTGLLGMKSAKKWALLANSLDASLVRNQQFYDLAGDIGLQYSPECQQVDLFVNGEYLGVYLLTSTMEIDENRIAIDENSDYLVEIDNYYREEKYHFTTKKRRMNFSVHTPDVPGGMDAIAQKINEIESAIFTVDSDEFLNMIDIESWAKYYLIQELSLNYDALKGSCYMYYRSSEGKLYIGPVWDMDNTLAVYSSGKHMDTEGTYAALKGWFMGLLRHEEFRQEIIRQYFECDIRNIFLDLPEKCEEYADNLAISAGYNHKINSIYRHENCTGTTWEADIKYVKEILSERLAWLDDCMVRFKESGGMLIEIMR